MATKVESYQSNDGKLFPSELEAVRHEVLTALLKAVPDIKDRWPLISGNVDAIALALQPLATLIEGMPVSVEENHPEPPVAETTLTPDHGELAGLCDCSAGMNGSADHAILCPAHRG